MSTVVTIRTREVSSRKEPKKLTGDCSTRQAPQTCRNPSTTNTPKPRILFLPMRQALPGRGKKTSIKISAATLSRCSMGSKNCHQSEIRSTHAINIGPKNTPLSMSKGSRFQKETGMSQSTRYLT
jgi:hypothetical protein